MGGDSPGFVFIAFLNFVIFLIKPIKKLRIIFYFPPKHSEHVELIIALKVLVQSCGIDSDKQEMLMRDHVQFVQGRQQLDRTVILVTCQYEKKFQKGLRQKFDTQTAV